MRQFLLAIILISGFSFAANAQKKKVLFIGNSYTGSNALPNIVNDVALSLGDTLEVLSFDPGGFTLNMHSADPTTLAMISMDQWDFVVIQEQSQLPSFSDAYVNTNSLPYARILVDSILSNNSCTVPLFFMTWGRENGDASNCTAYPPVCTFEGMTSRLRRGYTRMSDSTDGAIAPAGPCFLEARKRDSLIMLYDPDMSHPSYSGSYLTACAMYSTIFGKSPLGATFTGTLMPTEATFLQEVAHDVAYDSLDHWNYERFGADASFTSSPTMLNVSFTSGGDAGDTHEWFFGDGNTSSLVDPNHSYSSSGTFIVMHVVTNACYSDTAIDTLVLPGSSSIQTISVPNIQLFPNPAQTEVHFDNAGGWIVWVSITDIQGKESKRIQVKDRLDISELSAGTYTLQFIGAWGARLGSSRLVKLSD